MWDNPPLPMTRVDHNDRVDESTDDLIGGDNRRHAADRRLGNTRPRDKLGRPLPYGAPGVERQPEDVSRTPDEALADAQRLFDAGLPFHAHEVLEDAWKAAPPGERALWRGLAQLAVGVSH